MEKVLNYENGEAYKLSNEYELYNFAATSLLQPLFYEKNVETQKEKIRYLVREIAITKSGAEFVAKLAVYSRNVMYMRTIPLILIVELARTFGKKDDASCVSWAINNIINRPDEICKLLEYYNIANPNTLNRTVVRLSKQIAKGLKKAFNKFDEYQFAKWNKNYAVKLVDAINMIRPKPIDNKQNLIFNAIVKNTLKTPYTWEVEIGAAAKEASREFMKNCAEWSSAKELKTQLYNVKNKLEDGNLASLKEAADKRDEFVKRAISAKWEELIASEKIGYQALLMNLRNLCKYVSLNSLEKVCSYLSSKRAVINSKMFPFRFYAAWKEIETYFKLNKSDAECIEKKALLRKTLNTALIHSVYNIPFFDGQNILIASDISASMISPISKRSKIRQFDIGLLLGALVKNANKQSTMGVFGGLWKERNYEMNDIFDVIDYEVTHEGEVGYATKGYKVIKWALDNNKQFDKIFFFTDMIMYGRDSINELWTEYKKKYPIAKLYMFNLAAYGTIPIDMKDNDVYLISGWNNEIFNVLKALEDGQDALARISSIQIGRSRQIQG